MNKTTQISRRDFHKIIHQRPVRFERIARTWRLDSATSIIIRPKRQSNLTWATSPIIPVGSRTVRSDIPAVIYNRDGKIMAQSLVCTHLGCTVAENGS